MSELESLFAFQLDACGLTEYVREYVAIPGRRFRFDFAYIQPEHRLLIEINGGTFVRGGHSTGLGIRRDYEKGNLAVQHGFRVLQFDANMVKSGEAVRVTEQVLKGA